ncbi:unnamed protein product, partial [Gongylonema pulchrum]|uniref:CARMIL_C domain-containing protein n=1 Tax=Gongylonema pulchrum TaxID=637853 RepID=A0A183DCB9_9BILA
MSFLLQTILFTTSDAILELIAQNDKCMRPDEMMRSALDLPHLVDSLTTEGPETSPLTLPDSRGRSGESAFMLGGVRPFTGDRKQRVRSATRSSDRKPSSARAADEMASKLSVVATSTDDHSVDKGETKRESEEKKEEENMDIPLLKGF